MRSQHQAVLLAVALASGATVASARAVRFARLPVAHLDAPPAGSLVPGSIAGTEHAKGIVAVRSPVSSYDPGPARYVELYSSAKDAKEYRSRGLPGPDSKDVCFAVMQTFGFHQDHPAWPTAVSAHPTVMLETAVPAAARAAGMHMGGVTAVHREELVTSGASAKLSVTDAWVDPRTLGVRLLGSHTLPLARVAVGPGHVAVYAFRDGHTVQFVVTAPEMPQPRAADHGLVAGMQAMLGDTPGVKVNAMPAFVGSMTRQLISSGSSGDMGSSDCGHIRVRLDVTPGHGDAASVSAQVALPPLEPDPGGNPEVRLRPLAIQLSASQTPSESIPTCSVSFGWAGPERSQPF